MDTINQLDIEESRETLESKREKTGRKESKGR